MFRLFCQFWNISDFLVFHVTLSVLMLKKWNFAVILSIKDKEIVKRLKFGSYCMINCGETDNDIFLWFLVFEWLHAGVITEADGCIILIRPNCWVSHRWPVGCIKRVENYINITKQCIHKAAGSRISEMIFSNCSWRYLMFIIYETGLGK